MLAITASLVLIVVAVATVLATRAILWIDEAAGRSRSLAAVLDIDSERLDLLLDSLALSERFDPDGEEARRIRHELLGLSTDLVPHLVTRLWVAWRNDVPDVRLAGVLSILCDSEDPRAADALSRFFLTNTIPLDARPVMSLSANRSTVEYALDVLVRAPQTMVRGWDRDDFETFHLRKRLLLWEVPSELVVRRLEGLRDTRSRALLLSLLLERQQAEGAIDPDPYLQSADSDEAIVLYRVFAGLEASSIDLPTGHPVRSRIRLAVAPWALGDREPVHRHGFNPMPDSDEGSPEVGIRRVAMLALALADREGQLLASESIRNRLRSHFTNWRLIDEAIEIAARCETDVAETIRSAFISAAVDKHHDLRDSLRGYFSREYVRRRVVGSREQNEREFAAEILRELEKKAD
ncbi:hypothetical protein [Actinomycetospora soli]|uniref:hypothetical protein n=1 Tax=Actinomycetospora soli TaxID=2893887 RepID=UPI001E601569|nr:hypothetical protein [Actinomycetospora soli]MCD2191563.1 hypothetical protein [Actinomycetospora soli]